MHAPLLTLPITDPVLIFAIAMAVFLLAPLLARRARVPAIIGIIFAGVVLGPNALNVLERSNTIVLLGTVGLLYLMFMAGTEIDLHGFKRYRNRSLIFGGMTFLLPQTLGTAVGLGLGYDLPTSILLASMFASHTLVSYPIATRFGIAKNQAVTTAVGGTIITDTLALLVLAVVAASVRGTLDAAFWLRLAGMLTVYVAAVWWGLPRLARWFFRHERTGATAEFVFVMAALFGGAYLAEVAGVEAIVGAFLVGLALNRLIPEHGLLNNRIHFVGDSLLIPFFLLSVGMLVDVRVIASDARAWQVMGAMTATVVATKWSAAVLAGRLFGYSRQESRIVFGLTVPQAAATLAATLIGVEIGLFDDAVLNGAIMMILATCLIGPWVTERFGRQVALQEERRPYDPTEAPQRILVPMARPATSEDLMDLALIVREPDSDEAIYPLTVFPADEERTRELVTEAEQMLGHAVAYAGGAGVPVVPLTRMDHNFASGIARGIAETRTTTVIIGWDGKRSRRGMFGTVLDQLLERTRQQVLVAKLGHPLGTTGRIVVLVPRGADRLPGYMEAVKTLKRMAHRLGAVIEGRVVGAAPAPYEQQFDAARPRVPVSFTGGDDWPGVLRRLGEELRPDDLVAVVSARRGAVSWSPALERLPAQLARLVPESFVMMYPSEVAPNGASAGLRPALPRGLAPERILFNPPTSSHCATLHALLRTGFGDGNGAGPAPAGMPALVEAAARQATELRPGVVLAHATMPGLDEPVAFLGVSPEGVPFPTIDAPARLVFALLNPEDRPREHLHQLSDVARLVSDPARLERMLQAESAPELMAVALD